MPINAIKIARTILIWPKTVALYICGLNGAKTNPINVKDTKVNIRNFSLFMIAIILRQINI